MTVRSKGAGVLMGRQIYLWCSEDGPVRSRKPRLCATLTDLQTPTQKYVISKSLVIRRMRQEVQILRENGTSERKSGGHVRVRCPGRFASLGLTLHVSPDVNI